jgi:hypothetical protein
MIETALVFDEAGVTLHWHLPAGRSSAAIADSRGLWDVLWRERKRLGGVAHTHPGRGPALPSTIDLTTFAACEAGLGRRLVWVIATADQVAHLRWTGPGRLDYREVPAIVAIEGLSELRERSGMIEPATMEEQGP